MERTYKLAIKYCEGPPNNVSEKLQFWKYSLRSACKQTIKYWGGTPNTV